MLPAYVIDTIADLVLGLIICAALLSGIYLAWAGAHSDKLPKNATKLQRLTHALHNFL